MTFNQTIDRYAAEGKPAGLGATARLYIGGWNRLSVQAIPEHRYGSGLCRENRPYRSGDWKDQVKIEHVWSSNCGAEI